MHGFKYQSTLQLKTSIFCHLEINGYRNKIIHYISLNFRNKTLNNKQKAF